VSAFRFRRLCAAFVALVVTAATFGAVPASAAPPERVGPPDSVASLGDSITRGFHSQTLLTDSVQNSWSTGTNTTVNSLYNRIRALNPSATAENRALTGAKMNDLARQANNVTAGTDLVTILLGANDACTSTEAAMTPVATYRAQFEAGMESLVANNPDALVYVASIPNIHRLWDIGRTSFSARFAWGFYGICQSMLANPTSTTATDVARRDRVRQRVVDFNAQLADVCADYLRCRFDDNAAFNTNFVLSDMSTIDYFHPNINGQAKAARVLWDETFDFTDATAPTTIISADRDADGADGWYNDDVAVTLSSDDPDLRGSEFDYRTAGATGDLTWTRYSDPITIDDEGVSDITARSIDTNGNVEAAQTLSIKIDKTDPEVTVDCPADPVLVGSDASATVTASDGLSGFAQDPDGAQQVDTTVAGTFTHQVEVADLAGNTAAASCELIVVYGFGGIEQPVNANGSSIFKHGSTVPLKFGLNDVDGAVTTAGATITVSKVSNGISGDELEAVSTSAATTGNSFRVAGDRYLFNLATKPLSSGTYTATITMSGGQTHQVNFSVR
jgi:lysophospholipase L1-like esterase